MLANNVKSSCQVYQENKYLELTTFFCIPFQDGYPKLPKEDFYKDVIIAWKQVLIKALELRMDSCISMLFRNRERVIKANEYSVLFKKQNGPLHSFNIFSFKAMEDYIKTLQQEDWEHIRKNQAGVRQLLKALYWVPVEDRDDHQNISFSQLISCLEEFTLGLE